MGGRPVGELDRDVRLILGVGPDLEALGGDDLWAMLQHSREWATYAAPAQDSAVILSGGAPEIGSGSVSSWLA